MGEAEKSRAIVIFRRSFRMKSEINWGFAFKDARRPIWAGRFEQGNFNESNFNEGNLNEGNSKGRQNSVSVRFLRETFPKF